MPPLDECRIGDNCGYRAIRGKTMAADERGRCATRIAPITPEKQLATDEHGRCATRIAPNHS
ncbi:MAG: hypothetical protein ABI765_09675, partial [Gemmatimonadota bacterium]